MLAASGSGFVVRSNVSMRISHPQRMTASSRSEKQLFLGGGRRSSTAVTDRQRVGLDPIKDQDAQRQQRYTSRKLPTSAKLPIRHTDAVSQKRVKSRNCLVDAKKQFKKTYEKLEANIRQKDDNNILKQMDVIWHHVMFGRLPIRRKISFIIDKHASLHTGELREYADGVCKDIEAFNAEIDRLHRLVFENRQIHF
jgi:hypothetical protein